MWKNRDWERAGLCDHGSIPPQASRLMKAWTVWKKTYGMLSRIAPEDYPYHHNHYLPRHTDPGENGTPGDILGHLLQEITVSVHLVEKS